MLKWYEKAGTEDGIIISTRVRFARNLREYPFPSRLTLRQREEIIEKVWNALSASPIANGFLRKNLSELSNIERVSLVERHLVSPELIASPEGRAAFIYEDESISIMVNEEDHLRIQVMKEGYNFEQALELADQIDSLLNEKLSFAFDSDLGYLTQCPTNLGTAMRASLMLHLPALQESGSISRISATLSRLGIAIRGTYGEASRPVGAIYQLSNQLSLGLGEQEAIDNLKDIAAQLLEREKTARKKMIENLNVQDQIARSIGILKSARLLSADEFMRLCSNVRLGISEGLIRNVSPEIINALTIHVQPATIQLRSGKALSPSERDALRAQICSKELPG
ncbi:MAG: protein arginine kinase [Clostridia bacterium]|nr:protein arginine kinase [Clostridia bacterium]